MLVIEIREPGGPDVLVPAERPRPSVRTDEVLIKVAAAGVNRPDVMQRRGAYPPPPGASDIPGLEVAGVIEEVGSGVGGWRSGDQVCALVIGWRLRRVLRRTGAAVSSRSAWHGTRECRRDSRNILHRVDQRLRARTFEAGRVDARSRWLERHRNDGHPDGPSVWLARVCHGRIAREVRRVRASGCRACHQLPRRRLRSRHERSDGWPGCRRDSRHGRRRLPSAQPRLLALDGRLVQIARARRSSWHRSILRP